MREPEDVLLNDLRRLALTVDPILLSCGDPKTTNHTRCLTCGRTFCERHRESPHDCEDAYRWLERRQATRTTEGVPDA